MNREESDILKKERSDGVSAKHAYHKFIKPFVEEKRQVLFEAFQEESITNVDGLVEIKRQLLAINALEVEIKTKIDTGRMAAKSLADDQEIE